METGCKSRCITRITALLGVLAVLGSFCERAAAAEQFSVDAIKAAYLYRIAGYVKWPGTRPPDAPFTIDVLGDAAVSSELARLLPNHAINGHPARVRVITRISEIVDDQMLYIGPEFPGDVHAAIASVGRRPVLIITDEARGLADGSVINFIELDQHVRFEVSLSAAGRAGLDISSQLLSVAARVEGSHLHSGTDPGRSCLVRPVPCGMPELVSAAAAVSGVVG